MTLSCFHTPPNLTAFPYISQSSHFNTLHILKTIPFTSHLHTSINLHPHNTPILMLPYTSHPLSQLLRNQSQHYLPMYLPAAGCQGARCNWRLAAGSRFWITCGLQALWGWGSAASWRLSWHCRGSAVQTQRSPSTKANLLTLGYRWPTTRHYLVPV